MVETITYYRQPWIYFDVSVLSCCKEFEYDEENARVMPICPIDGIGLIKLSMPLKMMTKGHVRYCRSCSTSLRQKKKDWEERPLCNSCYFKCHFMNRMTMDGRVKCELIK
jgi:hypothetical protein